jgi:SAM-dependent methyltransferase
MASESAPWPDASFDFLISIEVLEHVADVHRATREIGRLLKPGGMALITTPCANRYSFEWLAQKMSGGLQPSHDGFGRFSSDEPGHLRRLNDGHMRTLLGTAGVQAQRFYHRTHFFGSVAEMPLVRRLPQRVRAKIAMMDWHLFKHLPNGATMLVVAKK